MKPIIAIIAVLAAALLIGSCGVAYLSAEDVTITVKEKESVTVGDGNGGSKNEYRIYTDKGTFKIADSWTRLRFDSADEYAALEEGETYECEAYGFRLPFFSSFKNLIDCTEAAQ